MSKVTLEQISERLDEVMNRQEDLLTKLTSLEEQVEEVITKLDELNFSGSGFTTEFES